MKELVDSSALGWERVQCHKMEVEKCLSWKCLVNPVGRVFCDGDHFGHSVRLLQSETTFATNLVPFTIYLFICIIFLQGKKYRLLRRHVKLLRHVTFTN